MYAGIVIDTNNFTNQAGVRTFEAAAFLRRNGADVTRVRKLFRDSMEDYKARAEAVRQARFIKSTLRSVYARRRAWRARRLSVQRLQTSFLSVGRNASVVLSPV